MHVFEWSEFHKRYIARYNAPPPNGLTLSHIVGVPNHVRAWRTDFYAKIGRHNPLLSVADDYELILRSYLAGPNTFCHIKACGYYQYRNRDGNATATRNALIQHNTAQVYAHYRDRLPAGSFPVKEQWRTDATRYPVTHQTYLPPEVAVDMTVAMIMNPSVAEVAAQVAVQKEAGVKFHIFVVGPLPDIDEDLKPFVSWWNINTEDLRERMEYVKRFLHSSGELLFVPPLGLD